MILVRDSGTRTWVTPEARVGPASPSYEIRGLRWLEQVANIDQRILLQGRGRSSGEGCGKGSQQAEDELFSSLSHGHDGFGF